MSKTSDLERAAYHESGHTVVWREVCKKWPNWSSIADVHIIRQGSDSGAVTFEAGHTNIDITDYCQLKDYLRFCYAGFVAERKRDSEADSRFARWNARADYEHAILVFAFQKSVTWSESYLRERQHSLVSCAEQEFDKLREEAEEECRAIIDDNWSSVDCLARCLLLCGKVNGNFARYCFEGHEVAWKILESVSASVVAYKRIREILEDCPGLVIGPANDDEAAAWEATLRQGSDSID